MNRKLPPGQRASEDNPNQSIDFYSPHVFLLAYFDQAPFAVRFNTSRPQFFIAAFDYTGYNHAVTPNSRVFDCTEQSINSTFTVPGSGAHKSSTRHSDGVKCVFLDGHVQFVGKAIDLGVWLAISPRAGAEAIGQF